jgi:hypothetical protein
MFTNTGIFAVIVVSVCISAGVVTSVQNSGPTLPKIAKCYTDEINQWKESQITEYIQARTVYTFQGHSCILPTRTTNSVGAWENIVWSPNLEHCAFDTQDDNCFAAASLHCFVSTTLFILLSVSFSLLGFLVYSLLVDNVNKDHSL